MTLGANWMDAVIAYSKNSGGFAVCVGIAYMVVAYTAKTCVAVIADYKLDRCEFLGWIGVEFSLFALATSIAGDLSTKLHMGSQESFAWYFGLTSCAAIGVFVYTLIAKMHEGKGRRKRAGSWKRRLCVLGSLATGASALVPTIASVARASTS